MQDENGKYIIITKETEQEILGPDDMMAGEKEQVLHKYFRPNQMQLTRIFLNHSIMLDDDDKLELNELFIQVLKQMAIKYYFVDQRLVL